MIENIVNFIFNNTTYQKIDDVRLFVKKHLEYRTCMVVMDGEKIVGYARWNIMPDNKVAHVIDLIVHKDYRDGKVLADIARKSLPTYPGIEELVFERGYDLGVRCKIWHKFKVKGLLRRMNHVVKIIQETRLAPASN